MIFTSFTRRTLSILLLSTFSLAGFGPALHELAHLGPASDSASAICSCVGCAVVDGSDLDGASQERVQEDHDCAVCRFLALAKQATSGGKPQVSTSQLGMPATEVYHFSLASTFFLTAAPRGPPAIL